VKVYRLCAPNSNNVGLCAFAGGKQYDIISTSPRDLREFGLGVAM
jgi:hypothetical protein